MLRLLFSPENYFFSWFALPTFVAAASTFLMGILVLIRERGTRVSYAFFLTTISIGIWLFAFSWMYSTTDTRVAFLWAKAAYLGVPFIPTAIYHFTILVLQSNHGHKRLVKISWLLSSFFSIAIMGSNSMVAGLYQYWWGYYPKYGWLSLPYLTFFFFMMVASLREYWIAYQGAEIATHKERNRLLLLSFSIVYLGSFDYLAKYGVPLYPFGYLPVLVSLAIMAKVVWRYHLVDFTPAFAANQILKTMPGAVFVVDLEGVVRVVNDAACQILGYEESELLNRPVKEIAPLPVVDRTVNGQLKELMIRDDIVEWSRRDGNKIDVSLSVSVITDNNRSPIGTVWVAQDVTEVNQATAMMMESEKRLQDIMDNTTAVIYLKDIHGKYQFINRQYEHLFHRTKREVIGKTDYDIFPKNIADEFRKNDQKVIEKGTPIEFEEVALHDDGLHTYISIKFPVWGARGSSCGVCGVSTDITERKMAESALLEKTKDLARANAEREQLELFAYLASHDLQEPLQKIIGFGDLLKSHAAGTMDEKSADYLGRMQNAAVRMSQLIEDILKLSKAAMVRHPFSSVNLGKIIQQVLLDLELRVVQTNAKIEVEPLPVIHADSLQMRQLFQNLISNAIKFHKDGSVPHVVIKTAERNNDFVEIAVQDDGIGFDEKYTEKIFRPFERLHGRGAYEGSGIGLSICKKIVDQHKGEIKARSAPGKGSTFIVKLPAA